MNKNHSYNKLVILGVAFLLLLVSIFSNTGFSVFSNFSSTSDGKDEGDGFWKIDQFELENCSTLNGNIILTSGEGSEQSYNYFNYQSGAESKAYFYETYIFYKFFPPSLHSRVPFEWEIWEWWTDNYELIGEKDGEFFPDDDSSVIFKEDSQSKKIHHFRFKIDEAISKFASRIDVYWRGYGKNDSEVSMYCWQPFTEESFFGIWEKRKRRWKFVL